MTSDDEKLSDADLHSLGLTEEQLALLDDQVDTAKSNAGYFAIYRYADRADVAGLVISAAIAAAAGAAMPLMTVCTSIMFLSQILIQAGCLGLSCGQVLGSIR